jgi:hypothetical protein
VHGWVVPQGAPERAAGRAIEAFTDVDAAQAMASAAQTRVFDAFDVLRLMEGMVRKWEDQGAPPRATETLFSPHPTPVSKPA